MATLVELGPDDVLVVRMDRDPDDPEFEFLDQATKMLGIRAVFVLRTGAAISTLPADEVLRAVAGP